MVVSNRQIVSVRRGNPPVIEVDTLMNCVSAPLIIEAARCMISLESPDILVDCTAVRETDSEGLSALLQVEELARAVGGRVRLFYPPFDLIRELNATGLADRFHIDQIEFQGRPPINSISNRWKVGKFTVNGRPDSVAAIRHNVARLAHTMPFTPEQIEDLMLAVGEAASNAARYGSPLGEENLIRVRCECTGNSLIVDITDEGPGFDPQTLPETHMEALVEGGRGVILMRLVMDDVRFSFHDGFTVRLVKRLS